MQIAWYSVAGVPAEVAYDRPILRRLSQQLACERTSNVRSEPAAKEVTPADGGVTSSQGVPLRGSQLPLNCGFRFP